MRVPSLGLVGSQKHMDRSSSVESPEHKVCLVLDVVQHGRNCVSQGKVESPVARSRKGNRFRTYICGKDFSGIGPRNRALNESDGKGRNRPKL